MLKTSTDKDFDQFLENLPEKECRWAVYDFEFDLGSGEGKRNKLTFVGWSVSPFHRLLRVPVAAPGLVERPDVMLIASRSPDEANVRNKMVFASSKDALRRRLDGIQIEIQATDYSEITKDSGELPSIATKRQSTEGDETDPRSAGEGSSSVIAPPTASRVLVVSLIEGHGHITASTDQL